MFSSPSGRRSFIRIQLPLWLGLHSGNDRAERRFASMSDRRAKRGTKAAFANDAAWQEGQQRDRHHREQRAPGVTITEAGRPRSTRCRRHHTHT
jgi:hypothetical protein